jgi:hypothetical protein
MHPLIPRPVSVRQIVFSIEHLGTLLLADVWNHDFFFHMHILSMKSLVVGGWEEKKFNFQSIVTN